MSEIKFNVNYWVKVKLNDRGISELKRQHKEMAQQYPNFPAYREPKIDEDGYTSYQMHDLMNRFGHMMTLGFEPPFDTEVIICVNEETQK